MQEPRGLEGATFSVERVVAGDPVEEMLVAAFDAEQARLYAFARAALRDSEAAQDAVAETFSRLVREVRGGRTPDNVSAWLFRVCGNLIISGGRRRSVAQRWITRLVDRGTARSPEDMAVDRESDQALLHALSDLGRDARVALLMAAEGRSAAEIGSTIGRSPEATRTFLCRSRLKLRERLADGEEEVEP